jgi:hypothetical protein
MTRGPRPEARRNGPRAGPSRTPRAAASGRPPRPPARGSARSAKDPEGVYIIGRLLTTHPKDISSLSNTHSRECGASSYTVNPLIAL